MNETNSTRWSLIRSNLIPLFKLLWNSTPFLLVVMCLLYVLQALVPIASVYVSKVAIDVLAQISRGNTEVVHEGLILLFVTGGLSLVSMALGMGLAAAQRYISSYFSQEIETLIIHKSQVLPLTFFDQPKSYDQLQRARNGFGERSLAVITAVISIGSSVITLSTYLGFLSIAGRWLPFALLPVTAVSLYLNVTWGQQRYSLNRSQTALQREVGYLSNLLNGAEGAKERKLFQLDEHLYDRWLKKYVMARNQMLSLFRRQNSIGMINGILNFSVSISVMIWLFSMLVDRHISLGTYTALSGAVVSAIGLMPQIAEKISQVYENALFIGDLFEFMSLPEEADGGRQPFPDKLRRGMTVRGLEFRYPGMERSTLNKISFSIQPGERVAIVGENGSGKSTLAKCLLGLYEPTGGCIWYDGIEIREFDRKSFRSKVAAVFQDFMRYALTLRENVGFGNLPFMYDDAKLEAAAALSDTTPILDSFPEGWDTLLTRLWEGGRELSYGQWQRLAIARGLVREAQVIILDEPTAALDPKAEAALIEQFLGVTEGRTSLIISHRFATARVADHILVMKNGCLVEEGTHEQLMAVNGEYARMYHAQAQWYVESPRPAEGRYLFGLRN